MNFEVSRVAVEELLEYFVSAALGLSLEVRVRDTGDVPAAHRGCLIHPSGSPRIWAAWKTNRGPVSACAAYDPEQSLRVSAHVLWIAWWIGSGEHHEGWWHCYPKRPREWIKGTGTQRTLSSL